MANIPSPGSNGVVRKHSRKHGHDEQTLKCPRCEKVLCERCAWPHLEGCQDG